VIGQAALESVAVGDGHEMAVELAARPALHAVHESQAASRLR
jgi:hypothetical protein